MSADETLYEPVKQPPKVPSDQKPKDEHSDEFKAAIRRVRRAILRKKVLSP